MRNRRTSPLLSLRNLIPTRQNAMADPSTTTRVSVLIPALNEADAIGAVSDEIPRPPVTEIVVVDNGDTDIIVVLDGDHSDYPEEIVALIAPLLADRADLVIGSRHLGKPAPGALTPQQVYGNRLACFLIRLLFRHRYTDLGPFRAIRREALERLSMTDTNYGSTVEMQIKALKHGLRVQELPARFRVRIGHSKISGTLTGTFKAGYKIIITILRYAFR